MEENQKLFKEKVEELSSVQSCLNEKEVSLNHSNQENIKAKEKLEGMKSDLEKVIINLLCV